MCYRRGRLLEPTTKDTNDHQRKPQISGFPLCPFVSFVVLQFFYPVKMQISR